MNTKRPVIFYFLFLYVFSLLLLLASPVSAYGESAGDGDIIKSKNSESFEAYEKILLSGQSREFRLNEPWAKIALSRINKWKEFQENFPDSPLIGQTHLRIAEMYLTILKDDPYLENFFDIITGKKANPKDVYQGIIQRALDRLNKAINNYPNVPHYSYLGDDKFGFIGDTVGSFGLYTRAFFFKSYRNKDIDTLQKVYGNTPSAKQALRDIKPVMEPPVFQIPRIRIF